MGLSDCLYMQVGEKPETYIVHTHTVPRSRGTNGMLLLSGICDVVNISPPPQTTETCMILCSLTVCVEWGKWAVVLMVDA